MQKLYADTQGKMLEGAMEHLIGNVRVFVQHQAGDKVIPGEGGEMTSLAEVL